MDNTKFESIQFYKDIILAIDYIHKHNFAHLNIRLNNLLYYKNKDGEFNPVIKEFSNCSEIINNNNKITKQNINIINNSAYNPPEIYNEDSNINGIDPIKYDIWCCGILFYILIVGDTPFISTLPNDYDYCHFIEDYNNNKFLSNYIFSDELLQMKSIFIIIIIINRNNRINVKSKSK